MATAILGELVTLQGVADLMYVNRRTVSRWIKGGKLPSPIRPTGGKAYFRREDIERLLDGGTGDGGHDDRAAMPTGVRPGGGLASASGPGLGSAEGEAVDLAEGGQRSGVGGDR